MYTCIDISIYIHTYIYICDIKSLDESHVTQSSLPSPRNETRNVVQQQVPVHRKTGHLSTPWTPWTRQALHGFTVKSLAKVWAFWGFPAEDCKFIDFLIFHSPKKGTGRLHVCHRKKTVVCMIATI